MRVRVRVLVQYACSKKRMDRGYRAFTVQQYRIIPRSRCLGLQDSAWRENEERALRVPCKAVMRPQPQQRDYTTVKAPILFFKSNLYTTGTNHWQPNSYGPGISEPLSLLQVHKFYNPTSTGKKTAAQYTALDSIPLISSIF